MKIFAIKDIKAEGFNIPFFQPTFGLAERNFKEACQDTSSPLHKNKEDFSLYYLGTFDHTSGQMTLEPQPKHVVDAN